VRLVWALWARPWLSFNGFETSYRLPTGAGVEMQTNSSTAALARESGRLQSRPPPPRQTEPEALRADLEALLASHGVAYSYSKTSKFANFVNRTLV
jgi:hypothetical protein